MLDTGQQRRAGPQVLLLRRQILTGTTYGIGATLLFRHVSRDRPDVADGPSRLPHAAAPETRGRGGAGGASDHGERSDTVRRARQGGGRDGSRPVHRAQLADRGRPRSASKGDPGVLVVGQSADGEPLGC